MFCAIFGRNWPNGSGEKALKIFTIYNFTFFHYYLPLESGLALHLNKLESPSPKDALCQVCLKLANRFWRRKLINVLNRNLQFHYHLPLEKGVDFHLNKLESQSSTQGCFVSRLIEIGPVVLEKILKYFQYNFTFLL